MDSHVTIGKNMSDGPRMTSLALRSHFFLHPFASCSPVATQQRTSTPHCQTYSPDYCQVKVTGVQLGMHLETIRSF